MKPIMTRVPDDVYEVLMREKMNSSLSSLVANILCAYIDDIAEIDRMEKNEAVTAI